MKKLCSIILGIIVGGIALLIMLSLDLLFSFSSRSTIYPVLGFCVPAINGYAAYIISYESHLDLFGWIANLIRKKRHANKPLDNAASSENHPEEPVSQPVESASSSQPEGHSLNPDKNVCSNSENTPKEKIIPLKSSKLDALPQNQSSRRDAFLYPYFPAVQNGLPLVYYYPNNLISELDSTLLDAVVDSIILSKNYSVDIFPLSSDYAEIRYQGKRLGTILRHGNMVADWIKRKDPIICNITSVSDGKEAVGIGFYKDVESRLKSCNHDIARLTKNISEDMQISVSCLSEGEMLKFFPDYIEEEGAIPIQSITGGGVGFLPKRYNQLHENFGIRGVFVDHVDEIINDNGDYKYSAYVRVYWN